MSRCHPIPKKAFRFSHGFTLIEMLVVVSIIAILAVSSLQALQGTLSGLNLKGGANTVAAQLDLARQTASTRNFAVDVRLYQDSSKSRDNNGNYPYRLIALVIPASVSGATSDEFVSLPVALPADVIIDSAPTYSSVLNVSLGASGFQPIAALELSTAPYAVRNLPYIKFTYLPNGRINLDPNLPSGQQWCLTLLNQNKASLPVSNNGPASNFVTLVLDVQTGRDRVYQP